MKEIKRQGILLSSSLTISAVAATEMPVLPQDTSWQMEQAYTAAQLSFLGPGHPHWRLQWVPNVNWVFSLTQDLVAEARQAAIAAHGGGHQGGQNQLPIVQNPPQGKQASPFPLCRAPHKGQ